MKVVGSVRARRLLIAVGLVLAMGAGGVACGSDEKAEEDPFVGAAEVCDGLFAGPLAKKVESVTGDTVFFSSGTKGLDNVVEALKRGYASGRSWATGAELCALSPKGGAVGDGGGLKFSMYAPQDVDDPRMSDGSELYTMGKRSEARSGGASLYFECASPQVKGSSENPLRIYGSFGRGKSDAPDTRESRDANLEILHAASLAVVKELDCENNAGLPKTPVLTPK
ncbi:hypothetical protein OG930_16565 [Streptomyces sp. NBC_01799]|uniref:hypothetical protein n=1 Tax=Streptomyces sp. NBC_01800 TaxID=2975945 RepID=UPI002DDA8810|nr:hypothetical protein [Streptomyces sp. NBC_01800]WSA68471.1 hypothetical protein OIE65_16590 [Streptomyces sp. NBC_01800]WSA77083.1 hypothetical protein OG930_16565 [Streptomyces sp. NBC_01799]